MKGATEEVSRVERLVSFGGRVSLFVLVGLPAFLLAIPINWFLVEKIELAKPVAYLSVLIIQVVINFFITRRFVFSPTRARSVRRQFFLFMIGIMAFRSVEWLIYSLAVENIELANRFYLVVQAGNVILFATLKFLYSKHVFEGGDKAIFYKTTRFHRKSKSLR